MGFKEVIQEDIKDVFVKLDEFGEKRMIDEKESLVIIENNELNERGKRNNDLHLEEIVILIAAEDFGKLPAVGRIIKIDKRIFKVVNAINEDGIYSIRARENKS